jgi:hypothetical protein
MIHKQPKKREIAMRSDIDHRKSVVLQEADLDPLICPFVSLVAVRLSWLLSMCPATEKFLPEAATAIRVGGKSVMT